MPCSHTATCPLFPLLNSSVDGWRRCYCDSPDGWRECARYKQSVRGQYVPLSLLPNGHDARHLQHAGGEGGPAADDAVTPQAARTPSGAGPTLVDLLFEPAPSHAPPPPSDDWSSRSTPVPHPRSPAPAPSNPAPPVVHRPSSRRHWWTRLAEWMRTPA
jgi:hypothetical protein